MKKKIPFAAMTSAFVLASFIATPLTPIANEVEVDPVGDFTLSLMHTNDTHAKVETIPHRITEIKKIRAEKPNAVLLDAGDAFTGTLYFNEFKGQADLKLMNLAGYDIMTFGNHEFDLGSSAEGHQALVDFIKAAKFPFVSSNVDFSKDEKFNGLFSDLVSSEPENGKIYNGIIKEIEGKKVGFFGLTTLDTKNISSPKKVEFENYLQEAEKAVQAFENEGVDIIVAVSHLGYDDTAAVDNDLSLASQVDGIDVIVGGHTHTQLQQPIFVNKDENGEVKDPTVIVQAGSQGDYLGSIDVQFDENGVVVGQDGSLIGIKSVEALEKDGKLELADTEALTILEEYKTKVDEVAAKEIGVDAEVELANPRTNGDNSHISVRKNETILGNLITDGMLDKAKEFTGKEDIIMALQNGGGIRSSINSGPITTGEVITVLPFGNTLATIEITGAELKQAFETSFGKFPAENGGFLHVSGGKVKFDSSKPAGERVVSIEYKKADGSYATIEADNTYTIATNAFTAMGGDDYTVFKKAYDEGRVNDLGLSDWQNFEEQLQSLDSIPTETKSRIVDISMQPKFFQYQDDQLKASQIAQYNSGAGEAGTEILAYDVESKKAFVTNGAATAMDIVSFENLKSGEFKNINTSKRVYLKDFGIENVDSITSVASHPTDDLVALSVVSKTKTDPGYIVLLTKDGEYLNKVQVGSLPDMVTFTPDGKKILVANEGEANADYSVDPEGSISIIDISKKGFKGLTAQFLTFEGIELDENIRVSQPQVNESKTISQQLEPEYITVSDDSKRAYVTLQENNAIATVDLEKNKIISVKGLGLKDHSVEGNEIDGRRDGQAKVEKLPILGFNMPDAIDTFTVGDKTYILTPNEGDARDYDAYSEEVELKDIKDKLNLKAENYEGFTQEQLDNFDFKDMDKFKFTKENGFNEETGKYEALYSYGGRSFSIFDADTMELVFDSGSDFEKITADALPNYFNTSNDEIGKDKRSTAKGPEPETVITGDIDGTTYAFIALERISGVMVYDLTNPKAPEFTTFISSRDFSADVKGDVSPEGLQFISAENSPTGTPLLVATHEVSGTVAVYEFESKDQEPVVEKSVGKTRYSTAIEVSKKGWSKAETVLLVNGGAIADGLTATPLASAYDAPVLLTTKDALLDETLEEIKRLQAKNVIIIGGNGVISTEVENALKSNELTVSRLGGKNRYDTSLLIAKELDKLVDVNTVYIAYGLGEPDALSIAAHAGTKKQPIILTEKQSIPSDTYKWLKGEELQNAYFIGGKSVIAPEIISEMNKITSQDVLNNRLSGVNRLETNAKVIEAFYSEKEMNSILVAHSDTAKLVDALAAGPLAAKLKVPVLLASDNGLDKSQIKAIEPIKADKVHQIGGGLQSTVIDSIVELMK